MEAFGGGRIARAGHILPLVCSRVLIAMPRAPWQGVNCTLLAAARALDTWQMHRALTYYLMQKERRPCASTSAPVHNNTPSSLACAGHGKHDVVELLGWMC